MTDPKPVLLLPGPGSVAAAPYYFGSAYEYVSYLTDDYFQNENVTFVTNGALKPLSQRKVDFWQIPKRGREAGVTIATESLLRQLLKQQCELRVVAIAEDDELWEPAACMLVGIDRTELMRWAKSHIRSVELPPEVPRGTGLAESGNNPNRPEPTQSQPKPAQDKPAQRGRPRSTPQGGPPAMADSGTQGAQIEAGTGSVFVSWERLGLECSPNGSPHPNLANAFRILANHPEVVGKIWWDEFHEQIFQQLFTPEPRPWIDSHDTRLTIWVQQALRIPKMSHQVIQRAVDAYARDNVRNEVREWMEGLHWDGIERLPKLMHLGFGADLNDYTAAVGRCWMVAMVARTFEPGCKMDNMPVFEGPEGLRKSSGMAAIGGKWFSEMHEDIMGPDFVRNLRGKLLIEVAELHAFRKADIRRIKGIVSCPNDNYRAPYERRASNHPRRGVWGGTTNETAWNESDTGARRFWPIACTRVDTEYLSTHRERLFAEAVHRYKIGELWWDIDASLARAEVEERREDDIWTAAILAYCSERETVTVGEILNVVLDIPLKDRGKVEQMRVASILKVAGAKKSVVYQDGKKYKCWVMIK